MRRNIWLVLCTMVLSLMAVTHVTFADTTMDVQGNPVVGRALTTVTDPQGNPVVGGTGITVTDPQGNPVLASSSYAASFTAPTTETKTITGNNLFEPMANPPRIPVTSNYTFDADGFTGRFDPIYWVANTMFSTTVLFIFFSLYFFSIGYSGTALNNITNIGLKILHSAFLHIAMPLIPFVTLALIGVFVWFGVFKKDVASVFGRVMKVGITFFMLVMLSSPAFVNTNVVQKVADIPANIGNFFGGVVEGVVASATGQTPGGTDSLINNAWIDLPLSEWVVGEEGQNYTKNGKQVVPILDSQSAWRDMLGYPPPNNANRNNVAITLEHTPDGPAAFNSTDRLSTAIASFVGNGGPILYFGVMGIIMVFARLAFILLVAAGAVLLPLELFPVTRSLTLTLRWIQYMGMSLFAIFFVSAYSSIVLGLTQVIGVATSGGAFGFGSQAGFAPAADDLVFLGQGLVYCAAIIIAWLIYKKMKPMEKIKTATEKVARDGIPVGGGVRVRAGKEWDRPENRKKSSDENEADASASSKSEFDKPTRRTRTRRGTDTVENTQGTKQRRRAASQHARETGGTGREERSNAEPSPSVRASARHTSGQEKKTTTRQVDHTDQKRVQQSGPSYDESPNSASHDVSEGIDQGADANVSTTQNRTSEPDREVDPFFTPVDDKRVSSQSPTQALEQQAQHRARRRQAASEHPEATGTGASDGDEDKPAWRTFVDAPDKVMDAAIGAVLRPAARYTSKMLTSPARALRRNTQRSGSARRYIGERRKGSPSTSADRAYATRPAREKARVSQTAASTVADTNTVSKGEESKTPTPVPEWRTFVDRHEATSGGESASGLRGGKERLNGGGEETPKSQAASPREMDRPMVERTGHPSTVASVPSARQENTSVLSSGFVHKRKRDTRRALKEHWMNQRFSVRRRMHEERVEPAWTRRRRFVLDPGATSLVRHVSQTRRRVRDKREDESSIRPARPNLTRQGMRMADRVFGDRR